MHTRTLTIGWTALLVALTNLGCPAQTRTVVRPGGALETLKLTCRAVSATTFECPTDTIRDVGHALIDAQADMDRGGLDVRACESDLDGCEADLSKWYRKWYITVPLGVLIGGAAATIWVVGAGL